MVVEDLEGCVREEIVVVRKRERGRSMMDGGDWSWVGRRGEVVGSDW